ncbi:MAG: GDSL-type esterase/lipase family protein [Pseudomonadota bacterium]
MRIPLARRIVYTLICTVLGLLALNLAAELVEMSFYGLRRTHGAPAGLYVRTNVEDPLDPGFQRGPQLQPGARYRGLFHRMAINSDGFRGPDIARPKPPGGLRVWCAGGSTTFDIYAPDDASTWPARLGQALQTALPDRRVEVINAGIPGEIMRGNLQDLVMKGPALEPDVLVIHQGPNEIRRFVSIPHGAAVQPHAPEPLVQRIALFDLTRRALSVYAPHPAARLNMAVFDTRSLEQAQASLRAMIDQAKSQDLTIVLATHAFAVSPEPTPDELKRFVDAGNLLRMPPADAARAMEAYDEMVREVAIDQGLTLADLRAAIPSDPALWGDAIHFSAEGSRRAGAIVAEAVLGALEPRAEGR